MRRLTCQATESRLIAISLPIRNKAL
jgi:hypothetical protein